MFLTVIGQVIRTFFWDLLGRWKHFLKKRLFSRRKAFLVIFFSCYRVRQTSGIILSGFTGYYGNRCASYKIISVKPNRLLKTQLFEKKAIFPLKNLFRPTFSYVIE